MKVTVKVDHSRMLAKLRNPAKRLAYATSNAINNTMDRIQVAELARAEAEFTLRTDFARRNVAVIKPRARPKKGTLSSTIQVGNKKRFFLGEFETGGPRGQQKAVKGKTTGTEVPVIGGARPSEQQVVPQELWASKLQLRRGKRRKGAAPVYAGLLGTYLVPGVGIFQREPGEDDSRILYAEVQNQQLPKVEPGFIDVAQQVTDKWLQRELEAQLLETFTLNRRRIA